VKAIEARIMVLHTYLMRGGDEIVHAQLGGMCTNTYEA